ncbi:thermonuclease family protein [Microvirga rosea]|nr:thermonuclease family protein [Microvirga rosea]
MDALESSQASKDTVGAGYCCGSQAAPALSNRIGSLVSCLGRDRDRYGRTIAVCSQNGEDLNAWMVASGYAIACRQYSNDYVAEEDAARASRRGIWAGTFTQPNCGLDTSGYDRLWRGTSPRTEIVCADFKETRAMREAAVSVAKPPLEFTPEPPRLPTTFLRQVDLFA